jgi:hypothetical protein
MVMEVAIYNPSCCGHLFRLISALSQLGNLLLIRCSSKRHYLFHAEPLRRVVAEIPNFRTLEADDVDIRRVSLCFPIMCAVFNDDS